MTRYRPDIDGLRAVAILAIILFHAGVPGFSGGYIGVDIFFVISGFLLTGIMIREIREGQFNLRAFYAFRIKRIVPALLVMLAATTLAAVVFLSPGDLEDFGESLMAALVFSSNVLFWQQTGYFAGLAQDMPLLHTWALAIEEQFYILFPCAVLLATRLGRQFYIPLTLCLFILSLGFSLWSSFYAPAAGFYLLPARIWEFLLGGLLAFSALPSPQNRMIRESLSAGGLVLIGISVTLYDAQTPFPGLAALIPCLGAALILYTGQNAGHKTLALHLLGIKPLVLIGLLSYSLYLWHWPLLVFTRYINFGEIGPGGTAAVLAISFLIALLSWRFIEQPFRRQNSSFATGVIFRLAGAGMLVFVMIGAGLTFSHGLPQRLNDPEAALLERRADQEKAAIEHCAAPLPAPQDTLRHALFCRLGADGKEPDFLLTGDSHAMTVQETVSTLLSEKGRAGYMLAQKGCAFIPGMDYAGGNCADFTASTLEFLKAHPAIKTVLLVSRWSRPIVGPVDFPGAVEEGHKANLFLAKSGTLTGEAQAVLRSLAEDMQRQGKQLYILTPIPEIGYDVPTMLARMAYLKKEKDISLRRADYNTRHAWFFETLPALEASGAHILHAEDVFCESGSCAATNKKTPLYCDDDTFNASRAKIIFQQY
ncbi:MAG: acyltransferase [Alphaproteobacteria bacterium]|nr:acyltransferase [Alphaproteobacteria bacterium]